MASRNRLWELIDSLSIVENEAKLVAGTKTLHHILPDLVAPMDGTFTRTFFGWHRQARIFGEAVTAHKLPEERTRLGTLVKASPRLAS